MANFIFSKSTINSILNTLINDIPATVGSYNFLIVGTTLIIPLGDTPTETYSVSVAKKDEATSDTSLSATQAQDGSTVLSQRTGEQVRITASVALDFFKKLFNFGSDVVEVSAVGVVDFLFQFAYDNFNDTDCILVTGTGIKGAGQKRLKINDWNRSFDPKDEDKLNLDIQFYFQLPQKESPPETYSEDLDAVNSILLN